MVKLNKILDYLEAHDSKIVLLHVNADIDALASAYALSKNFPSLVIGASESISKAAKKLATELKLKIIIDPELEKYKYSFVIDTATPAMLGKLKVKSPIVIDHHLRTKWRGAKLYYCDETKTSTSEIVWQILKLKKAKLDKCTALALLSGIIADTGRFKRGSAETFKNVAELLKIAKLKLEDIVTLTEEEPDFSMKIALLKGAQRVKYKTINNKIIAWTTIGAFESTVAKALLYLGADVAIVGRQKKEDFNIIVKAKENFSIHLGKLVREIGEKLNAQGSGHKGAAGIIGKGDVEKALDMCIENFLRLLRKS
ncbi:MAG: DHH family phosphoesterase [Candidatus Thermoplasmatota archaeon]